MRAAFANALTELAAREPRILLLTADLGFMALEPLQQAMGERFVNCGVAEQNMVTVAAAASAAPSFRPSISMAFLV